MLTFHFRANGVDAEALNRKNADEINTLKNRLRAHIDFLTGVYPPRNYRNLHSLNKSAEYIEDKFKTFSDNVKQHKYLIGTNEYKNIICVLNPGGMNTVVIGAHYDVCGEQPGADDNASGIAGLLEIGRLLSVEDLKRLRIELVAFTLEEPPFFGTKFMGSYQHARVLKDNKVNVDFMVCLEMIGYYSFEKNSQKYPIGIMSWFYGNVGNFIAVVGRTGQGKLDKKIREILKRSCNTNVKSVSAPALLLQGIDFSDHKNYWENSYKAVMITDTSFYRNNNYHLSTDTIDTLNFDIMTDVVIGIANTIVEIDKPSF